MRYTKIKLLVLIAIMTIALRPAQATTLDNSNGPELPAQCGSIAAPEGNKLSFHVYARGVQVYKWNIITQTWDFVAPVASLFAEENFYGEVGSHYVGPHWESKSGRKVKGERVQGTGCTPDPTAIEWLLLRGKETSDGGIFKDTSFIQRVNTTGGLRPTLPGSFANELKEVPYTAEYYFYRAENPNSN